MAFFFRSEGEYFFASNYCLPSGSFTLGSKFFWKCQTAVSIRCSLHSPPYWEFEYKPHIIHLHTHMTPSPNQIQTTFSKREVNVIVSLMAWLTENEIRVVKKQMTSYRPFPCIYLCLSQGGRKQSNVKAWKILICMKKHWVIAILPSLRGGRDAPHPPSPWLCQCEMVL